MRETTEDIDGLKGIIASGDRKIFKIFFTPPTTVTPDISATLVCTAQSGKTIRLNFIASIEEPVTSFRFSPDHNYGTRYPGPDDINVDDFYLENTGNIDITVASVMVTGDTDKFGIRRIRGVSDLGNPLSLFIYRDPPPVTLPPTLLGELIPFEARDRRRFRIAFKPQRARDLDVSITITAALESGQTASMMVRARTSDGITYVNVYCNWCK